MNSLVNNCEGGDLTRHPAHYDVTVMSSIWNISNSFSYTLLLYGCEQLKQKFGVSQSEKENSTEIYIHPNKKQNVSIIHCLNSA